MVNKMKINTYKFETVETREEATDLQEYYESQGIKAVWQLLNNGEYIVESWEE